MRTSVKVNLGVLVAAMLASVTVACTAPTGAGNDGASLSPTTAPNVEAAVSVVASAREAALQRIEDGLLPGECVAFGHGFRLPLDPDVDALISAKGGRGWLDDGRTWAGDAESLVTELSPGWAASDPAPPASLWVETRTETELTLTGWAATSTEGGNTVWRVGETASRAPCPTK